jgi:RimJ/RimL family protein N-acetyltransferase
MIKLEYFTKADFPQLIEWIHDEYIMTNWAGSLFRFPLSDASLDWYLEGSNNPETADVLIYKAVDTVSGVVVGHISLGSINRSEASARISRVLVGNSTLRGRGICQGMINTVLKIGFEDLNLHRIGLGVYDFNHAAIGCYKKAGFSIDGVLRDVKKFDDVYWNLVEMSVLQDEWKDLQEKKQAVPHPAVDSKAV